MGVSAAFKMGMAGVFMMGLMMRSTGVGAAEAANVIEKKTSLESVK